MSSPTPRHVVPPAEDLVHPPGADPRWRESYYFSFYDEATGLGGFSSIGKRAAKGQSGFIACLWGPDRPTLVAIGTDVFDAHDNAHDVAGLTYECLQPHERWRVTFDGMLNDGGSEVQCAEEAVRRAGAPGLAQHAVSWDLEFTCERGAFLYEDAAADDRWRELFDGHIDMVGRMTGEVTIDGATVQVDGVAGNDHSWGVRNWFYPDEWRWADIVMDDGPHTTFWRSLVDGEWFGDGALYATTGPERLEGYDEQLTTTERDELPRPTSFEMQLSSAGHERTLHGEVVRIVPVLFTKRGDDRDLISWNDRCLTRLTDPATGAKGWGTVEFCARVERPHT
ncbi:DUF7065 domain-containing protein [Baekduia soli]|uniref:DUF7065 domain-containing protein n=1 Tax=Baekduia soli TaxID=496014 RepID=UPI0016521F1F|nr:hypothetical protein [Baekduia soli]